jgi:hypothetical protein
MKSKLIVILVSLIAVFIGGPVIACDKPVVVDTWVQDEGKSTGKIVVKLFCPLTGAAAVPVVTATPKPVTADVVPAAEVKAPVVPQLINRPCNTRKYLLIMEE